MLSRNHREPEGFNVHHESNRVLIPKAFHEAWHRLFGILHPRESLEILNELYKKLFTPEFHNFLAELSSLPDEEFYHSEML